MPFGTGSGVDGRPIEVTVDLIKNVVFHSISGKEGHTPTLPAAATTQPGCRPD